MGHGQGMSMELYSSTPALYSIFAAVRCVVLCQSAAEQVARSDWRLTVFPRHSGHPPALGALLPPTRLGLLLAGIKCA